MEFQSNTPIYLQLIDMIKLQIISGQLQPGEKLPSVRALAAQLAINPNTIQRAYNELEGEGYIYSVPGKGSFAAGNPGADEARRKELETQVRELVAELRYLGVTAEELSALVKEAFTR